jgi:prepilin-type N-terminal cleavage/methylation domain-containing protein
MSGFYPFRAHPPGRTHRARLRSAAGFTLVEILTVMVLISVLTAITLSISKVVHTRQDMAKAIGEMDMFVTALDQFKSDYGDYPPMDNDNGSQSPYAEQNLLMALTGHARWTQDPFGNPLWEIVSMTKKMNDGSALPSGEKYTWGKAYIQLSDVTVDLDPTTESGIKDGAVLHDPWWQTGDSKDSAYLYRYKMRADKTTPANTTWQSTTFLLVSRGPDGEPQDPESNYVWKPVNKKSNYSGILIDNYADPGSNPLLSDNLVRGSVNLPPP